LAGANWVLSTVLAGAFGILVWGITGLDPVTLPFLIIPALGAALLGSFNSFYVTAFAGLGIGMIQALTNLPAKSWFRKSDPAGAPRRHCHSLSSSSCCSLAVELAAARISISGTPTVLLLPTRVLWPTMLCSVGR
jgi:hypothetical protein